MSTADDVFARVRTQPFVPLRVVTSSGESYDIVRSNLIMIGRRDLLLGTASKENPRYFEQVARIPLHCITALDDLPASSDGNG